MIKKKKKGITKCDKRTVKCDVGIAQCEDETVKCEKKKRELPYVTKVLSNVHNVRMEPSNVRKKIKEHPNVTKVLSNMMLELHNVRNVLSNARKKNKGITKCDKRTVIYDVGIT